MLVRVGSYVCFGKERFAWCDGKEENVVEVFHVDEGRKTCKVGYLAKHLAFRADRYDGLCARITEVYSGDRTIRENAAKRLNSLTAIDAHERQRFNELRGTVVSRRIFIRSPSLLAC